MATVKVTMTETVTYDVTVDLETFADLIGYDGDRPVDLSAITEIVQNDDNYSADYGVEGGEDLLDVLVDATTAQEVGVTARYLACEDRAWQFEFPTGADDGG